MPGPRKYQKLLSLPNEHTEGITSVAFSPCGAYIVTAGLDGKLCWWRTDDGRLLYVWTGNSAVLSLAWIPGREDCIICGLQDGNVAMLKVTSDTLYIFGFWAHKYPVECIAIDGDRVATGAHKELKIWDWIIDTHQFSLVHTLPEPPKNSHNKEREVLVTSLHWTTQNDRRFLMATYMYHGAQFFDASTGEMTRTFPIPGMIASASLSPNGSNIAVSNVVRGFDVYKVQSEEPLISFDLPNDDSASFARSPVPVLFIHEGHALVGGSMNGKVDLWDLCMGKMHSVTLTKSSKILALDAHCTICEDDASSNRFLIATGITKNEGTSSCVVWEAEEVVSAQTFGQAYEVPVPKDDSGTTMKPKDNSVRGDSSVVTMLIWLGVVIMALAYLIDIAALSRDY